MKRHRHSTDSRHPPKRQKTGINIGAPSADDRRFPSENNPSSSALSARILKHPWPPSLASLCINTFARHFDTFSDGGHWEVSRKWIQIIPEALVPALFSALKIYHSRRLTHAVVTTYFLRGTSVTLDGDLPIVSHTLTAIPRVLGDRLLSLELGDIDKFSDSTYMAMVKGLPSLTTLVLRNCTKVGPSTVEAIANTCRHLRKLNLNFTNITALSLQRLFKECLDLEVLKLAGIRNLSDSTMSRLFTAIADGESLDVRKPLGRLKTLKLRHNTISEITLTPFLQQCTNLEKLDASFTNLKRMPPVPAAPSIKKLSLTSTFIPAKELIDLVSGLPELKTLNIGAMGVKAPTSSSVANPTAMTLNDHILRLLTDALQGCYDLHSVNLVQNSKLGASKGRDNAIAYFVRRIGRKLLRLNLSGLSVRSEDLAGFVVSENENDPPSPLEALILNKSLIDDDCAPWISGCRSLQTLEVAETRISGTQYTTVEKYRKIHEIMTDDGLFQIIDSCPRLSTLNLTGCRGVKLADRRRFFDVWAEHHMNGTR